MVVETGINWYDVVDNGLQVFLSILLGVFLVVSIYLIVHYCKIIYRNYVEYKTKQAEMQDIKLQINRALARMHRTKE